MPTEKQTEWIINNILVNKGWHIDLWSVQKNGRVIPLIYLHLNHANIS